MSASSTLLSLRNLRCHFNVGGRLLAAVDAVNLDILDGEVLGLVGESGSGKSTLGRLIAGLQAANGGEIILGGQLRRRRARAGDFRKLARSVQMVFQDSYASLDPRLSIRDSLMEPLGQMGRSRADAAAVARHWLDRVGLPANAAERYPHELSGGQRQRVGIARAFIAQPRLVICDEPVSALDVSVQAQIINLLRELQRDEGIAMLFIAHDLALVRALASRTAVMYLGEIVEIGATEAVFAQPSHPYTRKLLASHLDVDSLSERRALSPPAGNSGKFLPLASDRGCRFAPRCDYAEPACGQRPPWLQHNRAGSEVACHRLAWLEAGGDASSG